jgi:hypothetical protein
MAARHSAFEVAILAVGLVAVTPTDAFAYVDPGTGSYLFQLATAGLLAGAFTIRRYWESVKTMLRGQTIERSGHRAIERSADGATGRSSEGIE